MIMTAVVLALILQVSIEAAPVSPAMRGANANKSLMKVRPVFKDGPKADYPEAAKAAGEHGKVVLSGILGTDGRLSELRISRSSRSTLLDQASMAAATAALFEPAKDADGSPISVPIAIPHDFDNYHSPGKGGGVLRYKCGQFVRDLDWWYKTWPDSQKDEFYTMTLGFSALSRGVLSNTSKVSAVQEFNRDFDIRWKAAIEECRTRPESLFIDVFRPEGKQMRKVAEKG